jgi:hypothetical protein
MRMSIITAVDRYRELYVFSRAGERLERATRESEEEAERH